jgi:hypothetical protein
MAEDTMNKSLCEDIPAIKQWGDGAVRWDFKTLGLIYFYVS